jgi:hypothetical protein
MFQSFSDEFVKIALSNAKKVEQHHRDDVKDWSMFENELNSRGFQKAVIKHDLTDEKLKKYVQNYGGYVTSKKVVAKVPSRTTKDIYEIRKLPGGRLGCGCGDWQYKHSVNGTDCDHIAGLSKSKVSNIGALVQGAGQVRRLHKVKETYKRGQEASAYKKAVTPEDTGRVTLHDVKEALF